MSDTNVDSGSGGSGVTGFLTCQKAFFCAPINVGMMIVLGIDLVAFIVLLISFVFADQNFQGVNVYPAEGAALAMANSVFFLVAGLLLAAAVFLKSRTIANICVCSALFLHIWLILLLFVQWIWQAVNWADALGTGVTGTGNCLGVTQCEQNKFGQAWGMFCGVILWILSPHLCQIINTWRLDIVGPSGMKEAFDQSQTARGEKAPGFGTSPSAVGKADPEKPHDPSKASNQDMENTVNEPNEIANESV